MLRKYTVYCYIHKPDLCVRVLILVMNDVYVDVHHKLIYNGKIKQYIANSMMNGMQGWSMVLGH